MKDQFAITIQFDQTKNMNANTNTSTKVDTLVVNGHTIKPILGNPNANFAIETKRNGTVTFLTQKEARRWARLNKAS